VFTYGRSRIYLIYVFSPCFLSRFRKSCNCVAAFFPGFDGVCQAPSCWPSKRIWIQFSTRIFTQRLSSRSYRTEELTCQHVIESLPFLLIRTFYFFTGFVLRVQSWLHSDHWPRYFAALRCCLDDKRKRNLCIELPWERFNLLQIRVLDPQEGTGIICGLGFTRDKETGQVQWDAMRNVKLHKFLTACSFQDVINSFNINTNGWVLRWIMECMLVFLWLIIRNICMNSNWITCCLPRTTRRCWC